MSTADGNEKESGDFISLISEIMGDNQTFLTENTKDAYSEIVDLTMDAIDRAGDIAGTQGAEQYSKRALSMFAIQILLPRSSSIYLNALAGNLGTCFVELRTILEAFARCYFADQRFGNQEFFMDRLASLEPQARNITKLLTDLDEELKCGSEAKDLWKTLSNDWVHTTGIVKKIVDQVINRSNVPPWALVVPGNYNAGDIETIESLAKNVASLRRILKKID